MSNLLQRVRGSLRGQFFAAGRHVAQIEDSRRILTDALHLQPSLECAARLAAQQQVDVPYADLGAPGSQVCYPHRRPLFITGRFRSGSTLLWQLFRAVPGVRCYYEPFNERRWFDPATRGTGVDPTHIHAENYWAEYEGLTQLAEVYREDWTRRRLYMDAMAWDEGMQRYVQTLIDHAEGRAVLQFNRVDLRLPWLRARFPQAQMLHIFRHPRDQWCSTLPRRPFDMTRLRLRDFESLDGFYLLSWGRDLSYWFPFLTQSAEAHPYELFYQIWKLSYLFGQAYCDLSIRFESLLHDPQREITRMMSRFGFEQYDLKRLVELVAPIEQAKWRQHASEDFFASIEARVERTFDNFFNSALGFDAVEPALRAGAAKVRQLPAERHARA